MNWMDRLERRFGRHAIPNLMTYIAAGMALVFVSDLLFPRANLIYYLYFSPQLVLQGQVWRLLTFIFIPPQSSLLFIVFALYFYYFIGSNLESAWGSFRFNLYYLIGMLGSIIAGFITGGATNTYLNLSLFFAFAAVYPDMQVLLFFILPIKIKYLAWLDAALYLVLFLFGNLSTKAAIVASLINVLIFFGPDIYKRMRANYGYRRQRRNWQNANRDSSPWG